MKLRVRINNFFKNFLLILSFVIIFTSIYIRKIVGNITFEQLIYSIRTAEGTSMESIKEGIIYVSFMTLLLYCILRIVLKILECSKYNYKLEIMFKNRKISINIWKFNNWQKLIVIILLFLYSLYFAGRDLGFFDYLEIQSKTSNIFEEYYVDPKNVVIEFPKKKRNLIYIVVESLEVTGLSVGVGGVKEESFTPNLEKLALDNVNFSNNELLGGALYNPGTIWTAASLIGNTAGVPLKISIDGNSYLGYSDFLPGVYSIGDILNANGYKNYFMLGSNAEFGGRKDYFEKHGSYKIFDYIWARDNKKIDKDYYVWWGYEDSKLYSFAKEELIKISKNDEPFNFTMLTADTHFTDGYLDESCPQPFDSEYANSYYCTDMMLNQFVSWIKEQDFYENTTIVITGDHLTMQNNFYADIPSDYDRVVYNVFLNSVAKVNNTKNRIFTVMDMFPTTLASLGGAIEGERLALGTNLYSNKKTLPEELGIDKFNEELSKKSNYYDNVLLGDTYYEIESKKNSD